MRATHWIPVNDPTMAQGIASIVLNFGFLELQLAWLLERLRDCPPNTRAAPTSALSVTLNAIKDAAHNAFGSSRLTTRLLNFVETVRQLSVRRNILIHGAVMKSSKGGLVIIHSRARERVIYEISPEDVAALDNEITIANLDFECFMMGVVDCRFKDSEYNLELLTQLLQAAAPTAPHENIPLRHEKFPRSQQLSTT